MADLILSTGMMEGSYDDLVIAEYQVPYFMKWIGSTDLRYLNARMPYQAGSLTWQDRANMFLRSLEDRGAASGFQKLVYDEWKRIGITFIAEQKAKEQAASQREQEAISKLLQTQESGTVAVSAPESISVPETEMTLFEVDLRTQQARLEASKIMDIAGNEALQSNILITALLRSRDKFREFAAAIIDANAKALANKIADTLQSMAGAVKKAGR